MITPCGNLMLVSGTRYCSGLRTPRLEGLITWRKAIAKHFDAKGWGPAVKSWMDTDRQAAVFAGHGLPEELSLACRLALQAGFRDAGTIRDWADQMLRHDGNGFVSAYLTSLGLFSRPLHKHPVYVTVSPPTQSPIKIAADSIIVTAGGTGPGKYHVEDNPGESGAHIIVIDDWVVEGTSFKATDQAGKEKPGPETHEYKIIKAPPANAKLPLDRVYTIRKKGNLPKYDKLVYVTRPMQSY